MMPIDGLMLAGHLGRAARRPDGRVLLTERPIFTDADAKVDTAVFPDGGLAVGNVR